MINIATLHSLLQKWFFSQDLYKLNVNGVDLLLNRHIKNDINFKIKAVNLCIIFFNEDSGVNFETFKEMTFRNDLIGRQNMLAGWRKVRSDLC